ncbi:MAG: amino acid permease, partial [Candidatus Obscuribacterales bacterium]|nr:amino acid permease [Candidatus Obscuribacterales bacterium]
MTQSVIGKARGTSERPVPAADLRVEITGFSAWMLGVGAIIGSMAWLMHGPMLARAGTPACITAWLIAAIATLPLALILMELSSMFPQAGGPYLYKYYALKRLIPKEGELLGFLTGWLFWVSIMTGLACMSNGLSNLVGSIAYGGSAKAPIWFGPLVIVSLFGITTLCNLVRVGRAALINNIFTLMKFAMAI